MGCEENIVAELAMQHRAEYGPRPVRVRVEHPGRGGRSVWRVAWMGGAGRKRTRERGVWDRTAALAFADRLEAAFNSDSLSTPWSIFEEQYLAALGRRNKPATVADARCVLRAFRSHTGIDRLEAVTREIISGYIDRRLAGGTRAATCNKHLRTLRAALEWAVSNGLMPTLDGARLAERSPAKGTRFLKATHLPKPVYTRRSDCLKLAKAAAGDGPAFEAAVLLASQCGMRIGELSHVTWGSVNLEQREIEIRPEPDGWVPKGTPGTAALSDRLAAVLQVLADRAKGPDGRPDPAARVLGGRDPARFERGFRPKVKAACGRAELPTITPHGLRRSLATILANAGMAAPQLQKIMRHVDIKTTLTFYSKVNERTAWRDAHRRYERAE